MAAHFVGLVVFLRLYRQVFEGECVCVGRQRNLNHPRLFSGKQNDGKNLEWRSGQRGKYAFSRRQKNILDKLVLKTKANKCG